MADTPMRALEAVRFLLELCAIVALVVAGAAVSWWLALLLPAALIAVWGRFIAPKSSRRLHDPVRLVVESVIFVVVGGALLGRGRPVAGTALAVASIAVAVSLRAVGSHA